MTLKEISIAEKKSSITLLMINPYGVALVILLALLFKYLMNEVKIRIIKLEFELKYFYHLAVVLIVVPEISWNIFDFSVWVFSYVAVGIIRKLLFDLQAQKHYLLNGLLLDIRLQHLLKVIQTISVISLVLALIYICFANWYFISATVKVNQILLYPTFLLLIDSIYMLFSCKLIKNAILNYLNNNIDSQSPRLKLDTLHTLIKSTLGILHFSQLIKSIYKTTNYFSQLFSNIYIISIFKAIYQSFSNLFSCLINYQKFIDSLNRMNKYLPQTVSQPNTDCAICHQQLINCRQIKQCGHQFHFKCIFDWIKSKQIPVCPVCRGVIIRSRYINRNYPRDEE